MLFPKDSAGRWMTDAVPKVAATATVAEVENLLRTKANDYETINYIYIINAKEELIGAVSVRELFGLRKEQLLTEFTNRPLITVRPHTHQERVAQLALAHNIKAVPVVSKERALMGVVPSDKILEVLNQEHTKAVFRLAGVSHKENHSPETLIGSSPLARVKMRLPWLVLGLLGGFLSALVIGLFEATLAKELILAAFVPTIVYMADAVGSQSQMLFVRALSIEQNLQIRSYVLREFLVNFFIGIALSAIIFIVSFVWIQSLLISTILATSIFITVCFTVIIAISLPWYFKQKGYDPAIASGPLSTVIHDGLSLCIYLIVASVMLSWWG